MILTVKKKFHEHNMRQRNNSAPQLHLSKGWTFILKVQHFCLIFLLLLHKINVIFISI